MFITCLRQAVVMVLMALLALAPFLHGHLGASHVSGFHVDGVDVAHNVAMQDASAGASVHAWEEEESPAMGVAVTLPQTGDDVQLPMGVLLFWLWALLPRPAQPPGFCLRPVVARLAPRAYQPGWPPPALAPPL